MGEIKTSKEIIIEEWFKEKKVCELEERRFEITQSEEKKNKV